MDTEDDQHIDGTGVAGLLGELAMADMTTVVRTCQSCHDRNPLGNHLAYRGAGVALRCPGCGEVAMLVGVSDERLTVEWRGTFEWGRQAQAAGP